MIDPAFASDEDELFFPMPQPRRLKLIREMFSKTSFSCDGRGPGYYADVSTGCQVYHMCDGIGRQFRYTCPNATLFQQRMLICDHWYMVNCSRATADYGANLLIGQRNRPFVEDSETNPYYRTPRPDLLVAPSNLTEFNIIYRTGQQNLSPRDFVGVESEDENSTDQPTYFPPSQWSTAISQQRTSPKPLVKNTPNDQNELQRRIFRDPQFPRRGSQVYTPNDETRLPQSQENNIEYRGSHLETGDFQTVRSQNRARGKAIDIVSSNKNRNNLFVNYKSNFKATTPVYSQSVEDTTLSPDNIGLVFPKQYPNEEKDSFPNELILELLPPLGPESNQEVIIKQDRNGNHFKVNFPSNYKATTPVYPSEDELNKDFQTKLQQPLENNQVKINFRSNFKATTPVYPTHVDSTSADPNQLGILPPKGNIVNFRSNFKATTPQYPTSVDPTSVEPDQAGVLPPKERINNLAPVESRFKATTPNYPTFVEQSSPNPSDAGLLPPKESNDQSSNFPINFESNFKATTPNYPSYVDLTSPDPGEAGVLPPKENGNIANEHVKVNFESNFRATTPNYPTSVDPTSPNPNDVGLLPPKQKVAYKSRFKATTPNYPSFVEATSPEPSDVGLVAPRDTVVNFHSDYRATTPDYPTHVESTSPDPSLAGLLAPQPPNVLGLIESNDNFKDNTKDFSFNLDFPAKFYQPPSLEPDYTVGEEELQEVPGIRLLNFMKSFNREQWQELRDAFRIPEYDFPLDDATRPSYDSIVNSFEPISTKK